MPNKSVNTFKNNKYLNIDHQVFFKVKFYKMFIKRLIKILHFYI